MRKDEEGRTEDPFGKQCLRKTGEAARTCRGRKGTSSSGCISAPSVLRPRSNGSFAELACHTADASARRRSWMWAAESRTTRSGQLKLPSRAGQREDRRPEAASSRHRRRIRRQTTDRRCKHPGRPLRRHDPLLIPDEAFDAVVASEVLEHVEDDGRSQTRTAFLRPVVCSS